jgi:tryptophanyl-tRNA synthetase
VRPQSKNQEDSKLIPGTDGEKMSKSRNNFIDIFLPEKQLKRQIMSIVTDAKGLEDPKDPATCNIFKLYELLADPASIETMRTNYEKGGYGYGHAKTALLELILTKFATNRERYDHLMANKNEIDAALKIGADKARMIAQETLKRVRSKVGY